MFKILLGIFLISFPESYANFEKCKNNGGGAMPDTFLFEGCPKPPCKIHEGDILQINVKFKARK